MNYTNVNGVKTRKLLTFSFSRNDHIEGNKSRRFMDNGECVHKYVIIMHAPPVLHLHSGGFKLQTNFTSSSFMQIFAVSSF